jgi:hypothetical protein
MSNRPISINTAVSSYTVGNLGDLAFTPDITLVGPFTIFGDGVIWDEGSQKALPLSKSPDAAYFHGGRSHHVGGAK